jgi:hypothetical protein
MSAIVLFFLLICIHSGDVEDEDTLGDKVDGTDFPIHID